MHVAPGLQRARAAFGGLPGTDRLVLVVVGLFGVIWLPVFAAVPMPRQGLVYLLAPLGLGILARESWRRSWGSVCALLAIVWSFVVAASSVAPWHATFGAVSRWSGAIPLAATLAWWSIGRALSEGARRWVPFLLAAAGLFNGLIAMAQVAFNVTTGDLRSFVGRGSGTTGNPVLYGALMAGIATYWALAVMRGRISRRSVGLAALMAFFLGLSGSRVAVVGALGVVVAAAAATRRRSSLISLATFAAGVAASSLYVTAFGRDGSIGERITSGNADGRLDAWRAVLRAWAERPLTGWGLGNLQYAGERQHTLEYARANLQGNDTLLIWDDPHNVAVHLLGGLGVVGVLLLGGFGVLALWGRRDWVLLGSAVAIGSSWLLQPLSVESAPIAALLFGMAVTGPAPVARAPVPQLLVPIGAVLSGVFLAAGLLIGIGIDSGRLEVARSGARLYSDAWLDDQMTIAYRDAPATGDQVGEVLEAAERFALQAARRSQTSTAWQRLATIQIVQSQLAGADLDRARVSLDRAIAVEPYSPTAWRFLLIVHDLAGDTNGAAEAMGRLCDIGVSICDESRTGRV